MIKWCLFFTTFFNSTPYELNNCGQQNLGAPSNWRGGQGARALRHWSAADEERLIRSAPRIAATRIRSASPLQHGSGASAGPLRHGSGAHHRSRGRSSTSTPRLDYIDNRRGYVSACVGDTLCDQKRRGVPVKSSWEKSSCPRLSAARRPHFTLEASITWWPSVPTRNCGPRILQSRRLGELS